VPSDWQLIRRGADGAEESLAEHVLAYDVRGDGELLVTNGSTIEHIDAAGRRLRLATDQLVERVVFVD
jgi:hypothetical protein